MSVESSALSIARSSHRTAGAGVSATSCMPSSSILIEARDEEQVMNSRGDVP